MNDEAYGIQHTLLYQKTQTKAKHTIKKIDNMIKHDPAMASQVTTKDEIKQIKREEDLKKTFNMTT